MNRADYPHASRKVLNVIHQMFAVYFWRTRLSKRFEQDEDLRETIIAFENGMVESSLIAMRAFDDFAQSRRSHTDDLAAEDFVGLSLQTTGIAVDERSRINKHIAHLTHLDLTTQEQSYSYKNSLSAIVPAAIEFCDYVAREVPDDKSLVVFASDIKEVCAVVEREYLQR